MKKSVILFTLFGLPCLTYAETINFACMIQPAQIVEVRSPITGTLHQLNVKAGSTIKKGQVLAQIEANVEKSATQTAYYRTQVKGNVATAQAKITHAAKKAERMKQLSAENFVSKQAYDDALNDLNQAQAELQVAKESLKQADYEYKQSKADLNRRTIYSPFNGVVMQQYIYTGSMVGPTEGKNPIFKIAQTDQFKINAIVPLKYFRSLKKDQSVKIVPEAPFEKLSTTVKLNHVDQVIDASSGTFSVGAIIQSNSVKFPSGIRCKMYI